MNEGNVLPKRGPRGLFTITIYGDVERRISL